MPLFRPYIAVLANHQVFDFSYGILASIPFSPFHKHDTTAAAAISTCSDRTTVTDTDTIAQHSNQQQQQQSAKRASAGGTTDAPSGTDAMPK
jgi:hypothetical protein